MAGYKAVYRFARISARKVRPLADMIRGRNADEALNLLRYQPHRGARMLEKLIKSALGNAEEKRARNVQGLIVADARVDGGPMFKRIRPRAMCALLNSTRVMLCPSQLTK